MKPIHSTLRVNLITTVLSFFTSLTWAAGTLQAWQNSPGPGPPHADAVPTDEGLVAHYPLDGDVLDVSGNGHHGTNTGVTFQPARNAMGAFFDGDSSRHIRVDNFPEIRSNLTVAAWFKPQQLLPSGAGSPLIGQGLTAQSAYTVFVNYNFVYGLLNWNSTDRFDAQVAIPTLSNDTFYHVALVYETDGGKVRIYLNGVSQGVFNYSTPLYAQTEPLYLGVSFPGGLEVFRGVLDDVRIYNRPLNGDEVAALAGFTNDSLTIVVQPLSRTNVVGSSLMLAVRATGLDSLAYQWFKDSTALPGATQRTYVLTDVQLADAGTYAVRVSHVTGFVVSSNAVVTVLPAELPSIIVGPIVNPANGHKYYLLAQSTWVEAEGAAQALGGHLATVRNAAEQEWVFTQFSTWGGQERILWIGLHDADPVNNATNSIERRAEFVWASSEPVSYANWNPGEPNNYRERGEYYVHTLPPTDPTGPGAWVDAWDVDFNGRPLHGVVELKAPIEEPASWTMGEKSFLFMRVNFPDDLSEPISEQDAYAEMAQVNDFYRRNSYGKFWLNPTVTVPLTLPRTKRDYASFGLDPILRDAREAARAAGYDTEAFDLDCVYFTPFYGGGHAARGSKGIWADAPTVIAHELGHNLGLGEADSWFAQGQSIIGPGHTVPYGNLFDKMGAGSGGQFNTRSKEYLGWLSNSNIATVFRNGTYRLYTFETTNIAVALPCALVVHKDEGRDYWIEFRTEDTNQWLQNGVLVLWNGSPGSLDTHLLNMNPGLGNFLGDAIRAPLLVGRTFSDHEAGIHITPLRKNATVPPSVDVAINVGGFPANQPPSVMVIPDSTQVAANTVVTLAAAASDPNGDALSFAWDFSDDTLGTVGPQVSHAWNRPGEYVVRCVVSDLKGGVASAFVIVRVGTPATRRISGRIMAGGQPLEGVRVYASPTNSTLTSSDGSYTLTGLDSGHYSILPTKAYYLFVPTTVNVSVSNLSLSGVDFTAETTATPNTAPLVSFSSPRDGWTHLAGTGLDLRVDGYDDGSITNVSFYEGTNFLGAGRYGITWSNVPEGQYVLRAVATDDLGLVANSADVGITVVSEPAANDAFSNRVQLSGPLVSIVGHTVAATIESGEPDPPGSYAHNSVWYSWVAPSNGHFAASIRADRAVATIYTGSSLANLGRVAFGATWGGPGVFLAEQGLTYQIAVDGLGSAGTIELSIRPASPPINDNFAERIAISGFPATVTGTNVDATLEAGEPIHGHDAGGASVWWSWMAPESGTFKISTEASGFRTYLAVYTGTDLQNLALVVGRGFGEASFKAVGGTIYQIAVDGERRGQITLNIRRANPPTNDDFANRTLLSGSNVTAESSNVDASRELGEPYHGFSPGGGTVWWSWTAPFGGPIVVRCGQMGFAVAIYTGATLSTLTRVTDDSSGGGARFNAVAGTSYQIVVDSFYAVPKSFPLQIERIVPPINDDFNNRVSLGGFVSTGSGANAEATAEAGEPQHSPPTAASHSMWWTWTAPAAGAFILDAQNSSFATALAVYTGNTLGSLARVGDNAAGGHQMTFSTAAGISYQIAVDGKGGATGNIQFTLRPAFAPSNDTFANRIVVTGDTARIIGFNTGASLEPGEAGVNGGASVWWTWTAPNAGLYTVTVTGTTFRVMFGVYTGSTIGALVRVAGDGLSSFDPAAQTTFRAAAGMTYQIDVDAFLATSGAIQLDLRPAQPPSNDNFANRTQLIGPSFRREANNFEASTEPNEPRHYPGSGPPEGASVWWRWTPPATGRYTVHLSPSRVWLLAIYTGSTLSSLTRVAEGPGTTGSGSRASFLAVAGTEYQIAVAGLESVTDEFTLTLGPAISPPNDDFVDRELLAGTGLRIRGSTVEAIRESNEPVSGYGASVWYTWIAPATGEAAINTEYNEAPTGLTVYTGNTLASLVRVPQSASSYGGYGVLVTFSAVAGQSYQIMVHSIYGSQGTFHLRLIETPLPIEEMPVFALPVRLDDSAVQLQLSGRPDRTYVLEASEDLKAWIPIATNSAPSGVLIWIDSAATNFTQRFYRARVP